MLEPELDLGIFRLIERFIHGFRCNGPCSEGVLLTLSGVTGMIATWVGIIMKNGFKIAPNQILVVNINDIQVT